MEAHVSPPNSTTGRLSIPFPIRSALAALGVVAPPVHAKVARTLYFRPQRLKARQAEREVLARGTRFFLEDEGEQVIARSWGRGPVVALMHGWSGHLGQLTPLVEPLVARGFQVVGFDWPGHGESLGQTSSLLHASRVLRALQRVVGPFHGVVAHSFGAAATVYAASLGLDVRRLAFFAPVARLDRYVNEYSSAFRFTDRQRADFVRECETWLNAPFSAFEPMTVAATLAPTPALLLHSEDDREVALDDVRGLAAALEAELRVKQRLGHRKLLRDEGCVAEAVAFVAG
jgi:alpha-beta hydrolase superfamily lysophospholipase